MRWWKSWARLRNRQRNLQSNSSDGSNSCRLLRANIPSTTRRPIPGTIPSRCRTKPGSSRSSAVRVRAPASPTTKRRALLGRGLAALRLSGLQRRLRRRDGSGLARRQGSRRPHAGGDRQVLSLGQPTPGWTKSTPSDTWQERLFELIRVGHGFVACKGGTGTLVELAVVWEMLNKGVMAGKPFVVLGEFWAPILERVREVELHHGSRWGEAAARLVHVVSTPAEAADFFARSHRHAQSTTLRLPCRVPPKRSSNSTACATCCARERRRLRAAAPWTRWRSEPIAPRLEREFAAIAEAVAYLRSAANWVSARWPIRSRGSSGWRSRARCSCRRTARRRLAGRHRGVAARSLSRGRGEISAAHRARSLASAISARSAAAIRRAILPNGEISDDASPELRRIRGGLARTRETIQKTLERILRARGEPPGEDYVTRRNDRFVIPVRASERRAVEGVVHAASATGQTVFVEPLETIDLNNRLVQLGDDEDGRDRAHPRRADRPRRRPSTRRSRAPSRPSPNSIPCLRGRASRAISTPACRSSPIPPTIALEAARHPVLENTLRPQGRAVVPLTLALGGEETVLVISGPNTGGKTVALKTVGLAVLAAQSGIPVAAQSARLPVFDRVLADIGDEQSIAADLSTFSAHMLNLKSMLASLTERSLVLVDEMGTGTAPEEGAALAVALLDEFRARRCLVLATTHHDRLKAYASTTPGVLNASVEFDDVTPRAHLPAARRRARRFERHRHRAAAGPAREHRRARQRPDHARGARGRRAHRLSASQPRRRRADAARTGRAIAAPRAGTARAARRMGRAPAQAHRRTRAARRRRARADTNATWRARSKRSRTASCARSSKSRRAAAWARRARRRAAKWTPPWWRSSRNRRRTWASSPRRCGLPRSTNLCPARACACAASPRRWCCCAATAPAPKCEAGPLRMKVPLGGDHRHRCRRAGESGGGAGQRRRASGRRKLSRAPPRGRAASPCTPQRRPKTPRRPTKSTSSAARSRKPRAASTNSSTPPRWPASRRCASFTATAPARCAAAWRNFSPTHPLVERIHAEADERGGTAVTVVELKD